MIDRFRPYRSLLKPLRVKFFCGILAGIVAGAASGAGIPFITKKVFPLIFRNDEGKLGEPDAWFKSACEFLGIPLEASAMVIFACALIPLMFFVRGVATFTSSYLISLTGTSVLEAIRLRTFAKLQNLPLSFHAKQKGGDLMSRVMGDTSQIQMALVQATRDLIVEPFTLLWAIATLIYLSFQIEAVGVILVALLCVPACVIPIRLIGKKLIAKARALQKQTGDLNAVLNENLASQPEIRAYNMQEKQVDAFSKLGKRLIKLSMKTVKYKQFTAPSIEIVSSIGIGFAIFLGSGRGLTLDQFLPVMMALYFCYEPVKKLGAVQNRLKQGEASLDRLEVILHADDSMPEPDKPKTWEQLDGEIKLQNVSFSYQEEPILVDVSLHVEPGSTVALVGESGAGKTTVVNLIERFYDVDSGGVTIDGVDVRDVKVKHLREQIAYVSQSPVLFSGSIRENILIGRSDASEEEVIEAAKNAHAHEFIIKLPDGYDTQLGERGSGLSGGQKQRVAIARACLKDAPILILDEATSALDSESEAKVQDALTQLSKERTTIIIAHRFSSIRNADRILVFEKGPEGGKITGDGSHDELMESNRVYRELYERQTLGESI